LVVCLGCCCEHAPTSKKIRTISSHPIRGACRITWNLITSNLIANFITNFTPLKMVLLTMTPRIVTGLQSLSRAGNSQKAATRPQNCNGHEPSLEDPAIGKPVSHSQIVGIWKALNDIGHKDYTLEELLKGSKVYVPPPAPKSEPVSCVALRVGIRPLMLTIPKSDDYKALMARLRREQEQREYERMANPLPPMETFSQRYPNGANMAQAFAAVNRPTHEADLGDDDVTHADVHRQLMLVLNFIASILGVAATLWIVARWWSTPARLFLTMGGSLLVGIAEIAVYSGYIWHLGEANKKDKAMKEVKEVLQTWTVGVEDEAVVVGGKPRDQDTNLRQRQKDHK
jgi:hypothetical protein